MPPAPARAQPTQLVVLKSYGSEGPAWEAYDKEARAYLHLRNHKLSVPQETHILKCYGTFWSPPGPTGQLRDCNILIEHADRGTLHDMYMTLSSPRLLPDIKNFWESLANVLVAFRKIHQEGGGNIVSIHQDPKPSNIFICSTAGDEAVLSQNDFNFVTKLGGFDRSHIMVSNHQGSNDGPDNGGSTTYSPPEMFLSEVVVSRAEKPWRSEKFHFLRDRDHIFLVDNSESMQKYQEEVMKLVEGLAYFLEEADPDGVEMMLVCNTKTTLTKYKSTNLLVARTEDDFAKEQRKECPMEKRLGFVLDEVGNRLPRRKTTTHDIAPIPRAIASFLRKKKRPASIYVLTDGSWSPETRTKACGVDNPIVRIMKTMEERTSERTDVSIQFVRYGNDAAGIQRLNYLDREIAGSSLYNITDHKSAEVPNLWDVLVGSLDQENDRKDEDIVELEG
ncbi:hypothetical protein HYQ44_001706 [Verticillium longisporum]|nr:hypothetical protein HYQ44_001706 [Verticillium longisporum]